MKVMLVDDEKSLCTALGLIIERAGYDFVCAGDGDEALRLFSHERPDLAVLDVMLPGIDGFELCERLRTASPSLPILMLSAKSDIVDKRVGFKAGADDYLAKPFDEEELLLRIEALLRRKGLERTGTTSATPKEGMVSAGIGRTTGREPLELEVDPARREVIVRGEVVQLTPKEFRIVELLASHPGNVYTRDDIITCVWGDEYQKGNAISIPTYVRRIREKIELDPSEPVLLQTVFGFGYRIGG